VVKKIERREKKDLKMASACGAPEKKNERSI
jgi:hypothetical protein